MAHAPNRALAVRCWLNRTRFVSNSSFRMYETRMLVLPGLFVKGDTSSVTAAIKSPKVAIFCFLNRILNSSSAPEPELSCVRRYEQQTCHWRKFRSRSRLIRKIRAMFVTGSVRSIGSSRILHTNCRRFRAPPGNRAWLAPKKLKESDKNGASAAS